MTAPLVALALFLVLQLGIGVWISRRIATEDDYLVAGRRLGPLLATFSIFATWFGAETVIGSAGEAFAHGVSLGSAEPFGYGLCLVLMGLFLARPLWNLGMTTLADLYRARFGIRVERLAAVLLVPASVLWAAAQIRAFGSVVALVGNVQIESAIGIAALFVIAYTTFGGLLADAYTDVIQGIVLAVGLLLLLGATVGHVGGVSASFAAIAASDKVNLTPAAAGPWYLTLEAWAIPVIGSLTTTEVVSRVIAARSGTVARRASLTAGTLYIALGLIPIAVALLATQFIGPLADAEAVLPAVARELLPPIAFAVFAGGLVSAILSTVDSTLLVSAGLLTHNLIVPLGKITDERRKLWIARSGVMAFGLVAYLLALSTSGVLALVEQASAPGSTGIVVTVLFGLFTKLGSPRTAGATLIVGLVSYVLGVTVGVETPFLASLALSLLTWGLGCTLDARASS
ncbi:sodium:solute symporter family protein [Pseudogemmatithrix spongiicola]|uniref:Sodium:solute symporter family protein n=1 Tax=Pseudogemmatithrix spongiicola TaxID=3062599 RepID=A0AA49Q5J5_9BACT|nr:sodium:solute symporter family protein [Gemmatimonadaceae bacterium 'strain 138']